METPPAEHLLYLSHALQRRSYSSGDPASQGGVSPGSQRSHLQVPRRSPLRDTGPGRGPGQQRGPSVDAKHQAGRPPRTVFPAPASLQRRGPLAPPSRRAGRSPGAGTEAARDPHPSVRRPARGGRVPALQGRGEGRGRREVTGPQAASPGLRCAQAGFHCDFVSGQLLIKFHIYDQKIKSLDLFEIGFYEFWLQQLSQQSRACTV